MLDWIVKNYFGFSQLLPESNSQVSYQYYLPFQFQSPVWFIFAIILLAIISFWLIYRKNAKNLTLAKKLILVSLRACSFILLFLILIKSSLKVDQVDKPGLVILIDQSKSMSFQDDYGENSKFKIKVDGKNVRYPSRIEMVKSALTKDNAKLISQLEKSYHLHFYLFSGKLSPLVPAETEGVSLVDEMSALILGIQPDGQQSLIASSVREVLGEFRGKPPAAIVLFTDGISSADQSQYLTGVAEESFGQYVPLYTIGVGNDRSIRDLELVQLDVDDVAYVNNPIRFSAMVRSNGYKKTKIKVKLLDGQNSNVIDERTVEIEGDGQLLPVDLYYEPDQTGTREFRVSLEPLKDELDLLNNQISKRIEIKEEDIQVLLIDGYPRWEFRALKSLLEREKSISLSTLLQDADLEYSRADKTALNHLPTKLSDLLQYDVIIMGDIDVTALSSQNIKNLTEYVTKGYGGILMIAGDLHTPNAWSKTSFSKLLPFLDSPSGKVSTKNKQTEIPLVLTEKGGNQVTFFQFSNDNEVNDRIWNSFSSIYGLFEASAMKPGVVPFVVTDEAEPRPVITFHRVGNGKVLFHFTDELWRWRFRSGDYYYGKYWGKAIRYLSRSRIKGTTHFAELSVDQDQVEQGNNVGFLFRLFDESVMPADQETISLKIQDPEGIVGNVLLTRNSIKREEFRGSWTASESGEFHVSLEYPPQQILFPETDFTVKKMDRELKKRALAIEDLTKAAEISKGKYIPVVETVKLPHILPAGTPVVLDSPIIIPLWNRWELLLLFSILLSVEWIIRKRSKLD